MFAMHSSCVLPPELHLSCGTKPCHAAIGRLLSNSLSLPAMAMAMAMATTVNRSNPLG